MELTKYIREYYKGTRQSALILIGLSIVVLFAVSLFIRHTKEEVLYSFMVVLIMLSFFQLLLNILTYTRSAIKEREMLARHSDKQSLKAEHQRMKKMVPRFPKIRMIQEIFFGISFISIFLGMAKVIHPVSIGIAIAVLLTMAIWIAFDLFAQRRAEEYERRLRRWIKERKR